MDGQLRFFQMDGIACGNWNRIYQTKEYTDRFHFISFHSSFLGFSQKPSSFLFFSLLLQPWARVQVSSPTSARKRKALFSSILFSTFFFLSPSLSLTIFLMLFLYHLLFFQFFSRSADEGLQLRSEIYCLHLQRFWSGEILIDFFSLSRSRFLLIFFLLFRFSKKNSWWFLWRCVTVLAVFFFCTLGLFCWADLSWFVNVLFFEFCFRVWIGEWLIGCLQRWYELEIRHYGDYNCFFSPLSETRFLLD